MKRAREEDDQKNLMPVAQPPPALAPLVLPLQRRASHDMLPPPPKKLPAALEDEEDATRGATRDVVAAGSFILAGRGWQHIYGGHVRWQETLGRALATASEATHRIVGKLTRLGVFDTLLALHYMKPQQVALLDSHVATLIRTYQQRADAFVWSQPKLKEALLSNAVRVLAQHKMVARTRVDPAATPMIAPPTATPSSGHAPPHAASQLNAQPAAPDGGRIAMAYAFDLPP